jgi:hypothetical protein
MTLVDAYLNGTAESTWRSYKSGWNMFVRFLVEQEYTNVEWEDEKKCEKIYLDFLNWVFVGRHVPTSSINITCSAISKFICAFIPQFNFAQKLKILEKDL